MRISLDKLHPSVREVADRLRDRYAGVPLVALGQTVLWDEPVKAALCIALEAVAPGGHDFVLGVNDHDYFSKTAAPLSPAEPFAILEHNDGSTRDLWVATGEISMLFGSETIPTRDLLSEYGVAMEKVAAGCPEGREACIDRATTAWGWRGIAQTGNRRQIAHEIRLADVLPYLTELVRWGFCESVGLLEGKAACDQAVGFLDEVTRWLHQYHREHPQALLSDAYRAAHRFFFSRLAGCSAERVGTFTSTEALRFSPETVGRPRFRVLDLFLRPQTRAIARAAYDAALEGSQIYTLDRFGPGAIPFDLVVPGHGRGTLRVLPDGVAVETPEPIWIATQQPVESAAQLAEVMRQRFGAEAVAVAGKALVFVCMICAEAMLVFHEGGSAYVSRTATMLRRMAEQGVSLPLYPLLRVRHETWDALAGTGVCFRLPEHLAEAFGKPVISGTEFARRWRAVVAEEERLLADVAKQGSTRELLEFLSQHDGGEWRQRREAYARAHDLLLAIRDRSGKYEAHSQRLYQEITRLKAEAQQIEMEKGENYRRRIKPLRERLWELAQAGITTGPQVEALEREIAAEEEPRTAMDQAIQERRERAAALEQEAKAVRKARLENEKGAEAAQARREMATIERDAERARLELVRRALLVSRGLPQSNLRPSAWWFPLVDPSGQWFENLTHAMEVRFEPLSPSEPPTPAATKELSASKPGL